LFQIPKALPGVNSALLNPRNAWPEPESFDRTVHKLAGMLIENSKKYTKDGDDFDSTQAGPQV